MKKFTLLFIVLGVIVINIGIFALRFSAVRSEIATLTEKGGEEEKEMLGILARRVKTTAGEASALLEEGVRIKCEEVFVELRLRGILHHDRFSLALIDDHTLREGDKIEGTTVIKIKEREVVLQRGEIPFTLKLSQGRNKNDYK